MKIIKIVLVLVSLVTLLSGCSRYPGWQNIRIEYSVPSEKCEYKVQESCTGPDGHCFNWFRQKATKFGANTVVITDRAQGYKSKSGIYVDQWGGGGSSRSTSTTTGLADYYYCPPGSSDKIREPVRNP